jgi:hypothetical protein
LTFDEHRDSFALVCKRREFTDYDLKKSMAKILHGGIVKTKMFPSIFTSKLKLIKIQVIIAGGRV